jgi:hypothetical protein
MLYVEDQSIYDDFRIVLLDVRRVEMWLTECGLNISRQLIACLFIIIFILQPPAHKETDTGGGEHKLDDITLQITF